MLDLKPLLDLKRKLEMSAAMSEPTAAEIPRTSAGTPRLEAPAAPAIENDNSSTAAKLPRTTAEGSELETPAIKNDTSYAACHATLQTTELLENILQFFSMRDLLYAQRVCQKWKVVIAKSETLQQNLFFKPRKPDYCWKAPIELPRDVYASDLVKVDADYQLNEEEAKTHQILQDAQLNPLVFYRKHSNMSHRLFTPSNTTPWFTTYFRKDVLEPKYDSEDTPSWRRMYITQPPNTELYCYRPKPRPDYDHNEVCNSDCACEGAYSVKECGSDCNCEGEYSVSWESYKIKNQTEGIKAGEIEWANPVTMSKLGFTHKGIARDSKAWSNIGGGIVLMPESEIKAGAKVAEPE